MLQARRDRRAPAAAPISRCTAASTCRTISAAGHLHARPVRRPRRAHAAGRRRAAHRRAADASNIGSALPAALIPAYSHALGDRRALRPARRAGLLHRRRHRHVLRHRLGGALQLQPHRRAPDRPEARSGRAPTAARPGLHPSNIHDNAYAIGAVDFTGDMPVILGPDGPSLGGFVCPATIVAGRAVEDGPAAARRHRALQALDRRSRRERMEAAQDAAIAAPHCAELRWPSPPKRASPSPVLHRIAGAPATRSPWSTAAPATNTCWSNTARWCSTSTCASACMR